MYITHMCMHTIQCVHIHVQLYVHVEITWGFFLFLNLQMRVLLSQKKGELEGMLTEYEQRLEESEEQNHQLSGEKQKLKTQLVQIEEQWVALTHVHGWRLFITSIMCILVHVGTGHWWTNLYRCTVCLFSYLLCMLEFTVCIIDFFRLEEESNSVQKLNIEKSTAENKIKQIEEQMVVQEDNIGKVWQLRPLRTFNNTCVRLFCCLAISW